MRAKDSIKIRRLTLAAVCVALCVVLPIAFHSIPNAGNVLLPMHIPVLICGMICGWPYGFLCGLMGPLLSSLLTGMPGVAFLPSMMVECGTYGLVSGLMLKLVHTKRTYGDLYIALVTAMVAGRVLSGIAGALLFSPGRTMTAWITANFVTALPGIVLQLAFLPMVVLALMKARVIPTRYRKGEIAS